MNAPEKSDWSASAVGPVDARPVPRASEVPLRTEERTVRRTGALLLCAALAGFAWWAATAPLDEAIAAPGTVIVSDYRKSVQSPAQGVVAELRVREGDTVEAGQLLVRLDRQRVEADYELARAQWITARASEARLRAERVRGGTVVFPQDLLAARADPRVGAEIAQQLELLRTRRAALDNELAAMTQALETLAAQAAGSEAVLESRQRQLRLLNEQIVNERQLAEEGFLPRNRLLEQQRNAATVQVAISEESAAAARLRSQALEQRSRIAQRRQEFLREVERELSEAQREGELQQRRMDGLRVGLQHTEIVAPAAGRVVGLAVHTVGAVLQAGTPVMDIVPAGEPLRVEAQVPPGGIDRVRAGGVVDLLFTAFNQATTPRIPGIVRSVAADVLVDPVSKMPYYKVLVEVTADGERMLQGLDLRPGMPAQVYIVTGERTFFDYLLRPLTDRMRGAFTER
jgi:protease secretion system membrane fusion protein